MITTLDLKPQSCPVCLHFIECGTVEGRSSGLNPDDLGICWHCGSILYLDQNCRLALAGPEYLATLPAEILARLLDIQLRVRIKILIKGPDNLAKLQ